MGKYGISFCFYFFILLATTAADTLPQFPLFTGNSAKPNILFTIDDSGSMDFETLFETNDGALWWSNDNHSFVDENGKLNFIGDFKYVYLFPNGQNPEYEGTRLSADSHPAIPPIRAFAFARSSDYNASYYDPKIDYTPWPYILGTTYRFANVDPERAPWDPVVNAGTFTVNLTQNMNVQDDFWSFFITDDQMPCDDQGNLCEAGQNQFYTYFPATYFYVDNNSNYQAVGDEGLETRSCSDKQPAYYRHFMLRPGDFIGVDAIGPDGSCLIRVEIKPSTAQFPSGRDYSQEIQNFANWFTYHRKRHLAMRGGLAHSLDNLQGIRVGLFWFNEQTEQVAIRDFDQASERQAFLDEHYAHVRRGGTPIRSALNHAGRQLTRDDENAPIIEQCQKNFTLLFTDGFASDTNFTGIGNADGQSGAPFQDEQSNTLADIAAYYYDTNLRPDLTPGKVNVPNACAENNRSAVLDCNQNLHMNTFTVGLGARGTLFDKDYFKVSDAFAQPPTWPDVSSARDPVQIDDLFHATVNGRGEIFNARTPDKLKAALGDALENILQKVASASGVAFNASTLKAERIILASRFDTQSWTGELEAVQINTVTGELGTSQWRASELLDTMSPNTRQILTYSESRGVPFRWDSIAATSPIKADLQVGPDGETDNLAQQRLNYLRGDRALEGDLFRKRVSLLGDIVHSTTQYVGPPELNWPDQAPFGDGSDQSRYSTFKNQKENRKPVAYVGANDGMLHAFDANVLASAGGGKEIFSYIPSFLASSADKAGLHYLTDPFFNHRFYVDLTPAVSDVYMRSKFFNEPSWRTVLIGGLRNGGRGLFALDVTDPGQLNEDNASGVVLWEFTDPGLGDIVAAPKVAMMQNGKFAVIFGNGYHADSGGALYIVFIEGGIDGSWANEDVIRIPTGSSGGLTDPAVVDINGDSIADRIYVGSEQGELWAFDVSADNPNEWQIAGNSQLRTARPLFTARDSGDAVQVISAQSAVVVNPNVISSPDNGPNLLVLFGTGKYLNKSDIGNTEGQSFYVVWDKGDVDLERSRLQSLSINSVNQFRGINSQQIDWSTQYGYYIDLPDAGERVLNKAKVIDDIIFFDTTIPEQDPCRSGGSGWLMSVQLKNGAAPEDAAFDSNQDGVIDENDTAFSGQRLNDALPVSSGFLENRQLTSLSDGSIFVRQIKTGGSDREKRLSWKEIVRSQSGLHR